MAANLTVQHASLIYTANFAKPPFELWGTGKVLSQIYEALADYKVSLQNFQLAPSLPTAGSTVLTIALGKTVVKFSFDKIEIAFTGFTTEEFPDIPKFLVAATNWLKKTPDFKFSSHQFVYHSHSTLQNQAVEDFLHSTNSRTIRSGGIDLGPGSVFNFAVPKNAWFTQFIVDKSQHIPGALYVGLTLKIEGSPIDYDSLAVAGRAYFREIAEELGLHLPPA